MRPPAFVVSLYVVNIALGVLAVAAGAAAAALSIDGFDFVRLGSEANLPTWYSASQLLAVGALAGVAVWPRVTSGAPGARWALAPSAFFVLLSLDEGAQVHERIGNFAQSLTGVGTGLVTGPWLLVALPLYGALAWFVWKAARPLLKDRPQIVALAVGGAALFVFSAAGIEALGNFAADNTLALRLMGVFEEVGEMMAATTLLWAAWALARAEGVTLTVAPTRSGHDVPRQASRSAPVVRRSLV